MTENIEGRHASTARADQNIEGRMTNPLRSDCVSRRTLLGAAAVLGMGGWPMARAVGAPSGLTTLSDWMSADSNARAAGVQACLKRIGSMDPSIHAWVQVLPQKPTGSGALSGIPFGVKDVYETKGLATEYGSAVYKGRIGTYDAAIVRDLRDRGAILLGKTQTAAFAMRDPPPTRNPRNLAHTPGGSSSGSAAAVAAGMVPFAIGTQTGGSTIRPASYCGITGFKATHGLQSLDGCLQYSKSLDTLGLFTHTPADMLLLWGAMGHSTGKEEEFAFGVPEPMLKVSPEMAATVQASVARLQKAGVTCKPVHISEMYRLLLGAWHTVAYYEGARFHQKRFIEFGNRLGYLAGLVREGLRISDAHYDEAMRIVAACRDRFQEIYRTTPVIIVPSATEAAPLGLKETGNSNMNMPWSALGTPAISVPMPVGDQLPLGLQLTAAPGSDARVIRAAVRVHRILNGH
jgi:Asp-tRNA(Asn)/Glu-tRNA(Gln) amidotransferase A subunit family amidase